MNADARIHKPASVLGAHSGPRSDRDFAPEASVVLLRPRHLSGTIGLLKRRLAEGWEVEVCSAQGTPMHLTLPERALYPR